jgi:hypothetical protein
MRRPCIVCGTPTVGSRCAAHARPNANARGYGHAHRKARDALASTLPAMCGYGCGTWLTAGGPWVAAHVVDGDPTAGYLVSCQPCNERAKRSP